MGDPRPATAENGERWSIRRLRALAEILDAMVQFPNLNAMSR